MATIVGSVMGFASREWEEFPIGYDVTLEVTLVPPAGTQRGDLGILYISGTNGPESEGGAGIVNANGRWTRGNHPGGPLYRFFDPPQDQESWDVTVRATDYGALLVQLVVIHGIGNQPGDGEWTSGGTTITLNDSSQIVEAWGYAGGEGPTFQDMCIIEQYVTSATEYSAHDNPGFQFVRNDVFTGQYSSGGWTGSKQFATYLSQIRCWPDVPNDTIVPHTHLTTNATPVGTNTSIFKQGTTRVFFTGPYISPFDSPAPDQWQMWIVD